MLCEPQPFTSAFLKPSPSNGAAGALTLVHGIRRAQGEVWRRGQGRRAAPVARVARVGCSHGGHGYCRHVLPDPCACTACIDRLLISWCLPGGLGSSNIRWACTIWCTSGKPHLSYNGQAFMWPFHMPTGQNCSSTRTIGTVGVGRVWPPDPVPCGRPGRRGHGEGSWRGGRERRRTWGVLWPRGIRRRAIGVPAALPQGCPGCLMRCSRVVSWSTTPPWALLIMTHR